MKTINDLIKNKNEEDFNIACKYIEVKEAKELAKDWIIFIRNGGESGCDFWNVDTMASHLMNIFNLTEEDLK